MKLNFNDKVREFEEEENIQKYNTNRVGIYFSDGKLKACWFAYHFDEIKEKAVNNDEACIKILLRYYNVYKKDAVNAKLYEDMLNNVKVK